MRALREVPEGGKYELLPYVKSGLWWASQRSMRSCVRLLAATARWWTGGGAVRSDGKSDLRQITVKTMIGVILILGAAGALRWMQMDLSFYNDEAHTFRRYIAGRFSDTKEHKLKWKPVDWLDTSPG